MNPWLALILLINGIILSLTSILFYARFKAKALNLPDKNEWIRGLVSGLFLISVSAVILFLFRTYPSYGFLLKTDSLVIFGMYLWSGISIFSGRLVFKKPDFLADNAIYSRYIGVGNALSGFLTLILSVLCTVLNLFPNFL